MKKKFFLAVGIMVLLLCAFWISTGLMERTDVALMDYSVSADGSEITLYTAIPSSMGYIRGFRDSGGGVKPHYLTFYSTFGGWNSPLGAQSSFCLSLSAEDSEIWFNRPSQGYELVLIRNADGQWQRAK